MNELQFLTTAQLAELLQVPVKTVYDWQARGIAPACYRVGKHLRWRLEDVEAWLETKKEAA